MILEGYKMVILACVTVIFCIANIYAFTTICIKLNLCRGYSIKYYKTGFRKKEEPAVRYDAMYCNCKRCQLTFLYHIEEPDVDVI